MRTPPLSESGRIRGGIGVLKPALRHTSHLLTPARCEKAGSASVGTSEPRFLRDTDVTTEAGSGAGARCADAEGATASNSHSELLRTFHREKSNTKPRRWARSVMIMKDLSFFC